MTSQYRESSSIRKARRPVCTAAIKVEPLPPKRSSTNSALVPWHLLDDGLKESNRQAAADIDAKLKAVGCEKYPVRTVESLFAFPKGTDGGPSKDRRDWVT